MINYWEIRPMPSADDDSRHCLFVDGDTIDVDMLLMKLGNICGRPLAAEQPYTYALYLYDTAPELLLKTERVVADIVRRTQRRKGKKQEPRSDKFGLLQNPAAGFVPDTATMVMPAAEAEVSEPEPQADEPEKTESARVKPAAPLTPPAFMSERTLPPEPERGLHLKPELVTGVPEEVEALNRGRRSDGPLNFSVIPSETSRPKPPVAADDSARRAPAAPGEKMPPAPPPGRPGMSDRMMPAPPRVPPVVPPKRPVPAPAPVKPPVSPDMTGIVMNTDIRMTASTVRLPPVAASAAMPKAPPPAAAPAKPQEQDKQVISRKRSAWDIEGKLSPAYTVDRLIPSANRFAHAAILSAIDSPGSMYNPLFLHGPTGSGKTHYMSAVAYGIGGKKGADKIFVTDGTRFSRGVHQLIHKNAVAEFEARLMSMEAICIDDIHLMALGDENRRLIADWLTRFKKERKQIVITSSVSGAAVRELEGRLGFEFSNSASAVELKVPADEQKRKVASGIVDFMRLNISDDELTNYFVQRESSLSAVFRSMERMKTLSAILPPHNPPRISSDYLEMVFGNTGEVEGVPEDVETEKVRGFTPKGNEAWGKWGFFCPMGQDRYIDWIMASIMERARELGIQGSFVPAMRMEYDPSGLAASAFKIAEECDAKELYGAVVLSVPGVDASKMSVFSDSLRHMLNSMSVRLGWLDREKLRSPSSYVRVLSDLLGEGI